MKMKRLLTLFLVAVMMMLPASTAFAREEKNEYQPFFKSITGKVKEVRKSDTDKNTTYVLLDSIDGGEAYLVLTKDTYFVDNEEIRVDSEVTGYYDANAIMLMIYPPQYEAVAIQVSNQGQSIKVDLFDTNLTSADHMLKLNISKDTLLVTKDGKTFKGDLSNRKLAVFYSSSTRSIPAQTTPSKVVVLSDPIVPDKDKQSYYASFTGTVTKITQQKNDKSKTTITIKDKDNKEALFTISKDTYQTNNEKIVVGSEVTGYFDNKVFRISIYPPQYEAEVIDVKRTEPNVKLDYFDQKLTSADGKLKLKIGKNTEMLYWNGKKYQGNPVKSYLIVIYDKATKSIPAQTEPLKIIVLEDKFGGKDKETPKDKDKDNTQNKEYWKKKYKEWKDLTKELLENIDLIYDNKYEFYDDIRQLFGYKNYFWNWWSNIKFKK